MVKESEYIEINEQEYNALSDDEKITGYVSIEKGSAWRYFKRIENLDNQNV